jgi:hypothetical protein
MPPPMSTSGRRGPPPTRIGAANVSGRSSAPLPPPALSSSSSTTASTSSHSLHPPPNPLAGSFKLPPPLASRAMPAQLAPPAETPMTPPMQRRLLAEDSSLNKAGRRNSVGPGTIAPINPPPLLPLSTSGRSAGVASVRGGGSAAPPPPAPPPGARPAPIEASDASYRSHFSQDDSELPMSSSSPSVHSNFMPPPPMRSHSSTALGATPPPPLRRTMPASLMGPPAHLAPPADADSHSQQQQQQQHHIPPASHPPPPPYCRLLLSPSVLLIPYELNSSFFWNASLVKQVSTVRDVSFQIDHVRMYRSLLKPHCQ